MNKNKIIIIILSGILVICSVILGVLMSLDKEKTNSNDKIVLTCQDKVIRKDEELTCTLKGKASKSKVTAVTARIEESDDFEVTKVTPDSIWQGDGEEGFIALYTDIYKEKKFSIATFNIKLKNKEAKEVTINIIENTFTDEEYEEYELDNISKIIKVER